MTLEEVKTKYKFSGNMTEDDLKALMMWMLMMMLNMSIGRKDDKEKSQMEEFTDDVRSLFGK